MAGSLLASSLCYSSDARSKKVHCGAIKQEYIEFVPGALNEQTSETAKALPVVVLLHGAGDRAENMIETWKRFASLHQIVRQTRDLLRKAGFPVRYVELKNHDHNYYAVADQVNDDAWRFFEENPLPASPK